MAARILVTIDRSPAGPQAVQYALGLADHLHGDVYLAKLTEQKQNDVTTVLLSRADDRAVREAERESEARRSSATRVHTLDVERRVPIHTFVADAGITAVVMPTHERNAIVRAVRGTVDDHVMRQLGIPVILLHPQPLLAAGARSFALHHVLIPLDGTADAERAIDAATTLDRNARIRYTLVQVIQGVDLSTYGAVIAAQITNMEAEHLREHASHYLDKLASRLRERGSETATMVLIQDDPARALIQEINLLRPDLVAMITHSHSGWKHRDIGGVTANVLHHTTTPVMLVNVSAAVPGLAGFSRPGA